ncbi:uncharacterized protein B0I36DRAFT_124278 [Microdochium trichocladiopsis]|uniref:Clr5 domain-containing protein n=1 Tax=Microdochium trichocladiopsis TaxID=1682393 RepID=A0A9P8Y7I0_9PEZI|nr:uncharacterized protein B0I36DRAFT_124278 [Microdochium trichocladiopsis]KAH7031570.1 hypothetical protein B0I36DRAFT_124278 [Microdochium trichocladiopsis]
MGPSLQALAPKPVRGPVDSNAQGRTVARTRPTTNQHHSDAEWLKRKPIIERLLFVDHLKIKKAVQVLERDHGFKTGIRSLKTRLEQWGFNKNLSRDDMKILIARKDQRKCQGKDTTFTLHGHGIQPERLATFEKRYAKDYGPVPLSNARKWGSKTHHTRHAIDLPQQRQMVSSTLPHEKLAWKTLQTLQGTMRHCKSKKVLRGIRGSWTTRSRGILKVMNTVTSASASNNSRELEA